MIELGIGARIAGYRIEEVLGRGGMGIVYRASDERLGRDVALKVVTPAQGGDPEFRRRFVDESRAAAAIDHPNVLPVYEAGEQDGVLFMVTRLVEGTDLAGLTGQGPLELPRALGLVAQVAAALDAAHARGLVHRDVKPANVLVTRDARTGAEHCYLTDFGLAQLGDKRSRLTATGKFVGTLDYIAPEQIQGEQVDGRADVYALGALLYECATGAPPFVRDTHAALLFAHLSDDPPAISEHAAAAPAALDGVVARALAKAPGDRFDSCLDLVAAAREAVGGPRAASGAAAPAPARATAAGDVSARAGDDATELEATVPEAAATGGAAARAATPAYADTILGDAPPAEAGSTGGTPPRADTAGRRSRAPRRRLPLAAGAALAVAVVAVLAGTVLGGGDDAGGAGTTAALRLSSDTVSLATEVGNHAERLGGSVRRDGPTADLVPALRRSQRTAAALTRRADDELGAGDAGREDLRTSARDLEEASAGLAAIAADPNAAAGAGARGAKRAMDRSLGELERALTSLRRAFAADGAPDAAASVAESRNRLRGNRAGLLHPFDLLASAL